MKPDDHKTGFDSMLRRGLAADAPGSAQPCPDADTMAAYYERSLSANEAAQFDVHLAKCPRCRAQVAALVRTELPEQKRPRLSASWLWNWRWLAPAFALAAIVIVWVGVRERRTTLSPPVIVATNRNEPLAQGAPASGIIGGVVPAPAPGGGSGNGMAPKAEEKAASPPAAAQPPLGGRGKPMDRLAPLPPVSQPKAATDETLEATNKKYALPASPVPVDGQAVVDETAPAAASAPTPAQREAVPSVALSENAPSDKKQQTQKVPSNPSGAAAGARDSYSVRGQLAARPAAKSAPNARTETNAVGGTAGGMLGKVSPAAAVALVAIPSPDPTKAWRIVNSGAIEFSSNSGQTWATQTYAPASKAVAGSAPSAKVCWIVGHDGLILRTANGAVWSQVTSPTAVDLTGILAIDAKHATVFAADGTQYKTKDGGKSWKQQDTP